MTSPRDVFLSTIIFLQKGIKEFNSRRIGIGSLLN